MTIEEIQFMARQVGLKVEQQPIGYRLLDERGRIVGSLLPKEQIEELVHSRIDDEILRECASLPRRPTSTSQLSPN